MQLMDNHRTKTAQWKLEYGSTGTRDEAEQAGCIVFTRERSPALETALEHLALRGVYALTSRRRLAVARTL